MLINNTQQILKNCPFRDFNEELVFNKLSDNSRYQIIAKFDDLLWFPIANSLMKKHSV